MSKHLFILVILASSLASCRSTRHVPVATNDSTIRQQEFTRNERLVYRDTTIYIPGQTQLVTIKLPCDSAPVAKPADKSVSVPDRQLLASQRSDRGSLKLWKLPGGFLQAECSEDSLKRVISILQAKVIEQERKQRERDTNTAIKTVEVEKAVVPKWAWYSLVFNLGILALVILRLRRIV